MTPELPVLRKFPGRGLQGNAARTERPRGRDFIFDVVEDEAQLARCFCYGFGLGDFLRLLFSGFLFFLLQLGANELEDRELGAVADAPADANDARVAAGTIRKTRSDHGEKFLGRVRRLQKCGGLPARVKRIALAEGDHFFDERTRGARAMVVVMRSRSMTLVTRLRSTARRCAGCFPSLLPDTRCRMLAGSPVF